MLNDYELFLMGCYSGVVRIDRENDDLYNFIELMKKVGLYDYACHLEKINEKSGLYHLFELNGGKGNMCIEFQFGKGFTFSSEKDYLESCEETKIISVKDLIKATHYEEDFFYDYEEIHNLSKYSNGIDLSILNDFCSMYEWLPIKCKKGFNILDKQFKDLFVEEECYKTFDKLINRIVGRAIDYFVNEMEFDDDDLQGQYDYGNELLQVAKKYVKENDRWLASFEEDLKEISTQWTFPSVIIYV